MNDNLYTQEIETARSYLFHYFQVLFDRTGLNWSEDSESEIGTAIEAIAGAAIAKVSQPTIAPSAGEILIDRQERVVYPYLYYDDYECDPYCRRHHILLWEIASPMGLLLISKIDGIICALETKDRSEATIDSARIYDRWQKLVNADRARAKSIADAIAAKEIKVEFLRTCGGTFTIAGKLLAANCFALCAHNLAGAFNSPQATE